MAYPDPDHQCGLRRAAGGIHLPGVSGAAVPADAGHAVGGGGRLRRAGGDAGRTGRCGGVHPQLQQDGGGAVLRGAAADGLREHLFP